MEGDGSSGDDDDKTYVSLLDAQLALTDRRACGFARIINVRVEGWEKRTDQLAKNLAQHNNTTALLLLLTATAEKLVEDLETDDPRTGRIRLCVALAQQHHIPHRRCSLTRLAEWIKPWFNRRTA